MSQTLGKKILSVTLATSTVLWLSGVSVLVPLTASAAPGNLVDGNIFNATGNAKVYVAKMVGSKYFKRWIQTPEIFNSYLHLKWSDLKAISQADSDAYAESVLVRALGDTKVYHVDKTNLAKHWVASPEAVTVNNWDWDSIYTVNAREISLYPEGPAITGVFMKPSPTPSASASASPTPVASTIPGVILQLDPPQTQVAAATLVSDDGGAGGGQSLADVMKIKFTAGTDGDVKVKKVVITRSGISADADIFDMYLYDGKTRVAETPSISSGKITFSSSGLFTVAKGTAKEITVKLDLTSNTASGKTMKYSVEAATDVETDGAKVQGTFPLASNTHSTANVTDLGRILFQNSSPTAATTVDAQKDLEIWRFTAASSNQDVEIRRIRFTVVGTISSTDLENVKLFDSGTQLGSTVANLDANKVADVDLSAKPLVIKSGVTKTLTLRADVVGGTSRTLRPSVQKRADIEAYDAGYKVFLRPMTASASDTFSIMQPNSSADFSGTNRDMTISSGTLTVTVSTDSPSGNIANAATNQILARYDFKAMGEDVKVTDVVVCIDRDALVATTDGLANGQLFVNSDNGKSDYAQIGTTDTLLAADNTAAANCDDSADFNSFSLGSQFIVKAGKTRQLEVRADISNSGGTATANGDTYAISLNAGNSSNAANAQGLTSLVSLTVPSADLTARTVTNSAAVITARLNSALTDYTNANPLIVGQSNAKIGSLSVTAGSGEAMSVTSIILGANTVDGREWGRNFTNLRICKQNSNCAVASDQIGATATSLSTTDENETKTFTVSPAIKIAAGAQAVFDVHADILSSASDTNLSFAGVRLPANAVTASGESTGTSASSPSSATNLQNIYIAANGTFAISAAPSSELPVAQIYRMSSTGGGTVEVVTGRFRLDAQFEDYNVERIVLNDSFTTGATSTRSTSTLKNVRLYVGSVATANLMAGPIQPVATLSPVGVFADFNGGFTAVGGLTGGGSTIVVPKGTIKTIVATAEVNGVLEAASGMQHIFSLRAVPGGAQGVFRAVTARGAVSSVSANGPTSNVSIGNTYEIRRNYPIVAPDTGSLSSKLTNGSGQTLYKFKITAPSGDESVRVKKMAFEVVITDTTTTTGILALSGWQLRRNGSLVTAANYAFFNSRLSTTSAASFLGGDSSTNNIAQCTGQTCATESTNGLRAYDTGRDNTTFTTTSSTTKVTLAFATEEAISAGATNSYEIVANVSNVSGGSADSDSVAIRILGDTNLLANDRTGDVSVATNASGEIFSVDSSLTDSNFLWSDVWPGASNHADPTAVTGTVTSSNDWTNGVLVPESVVSGVATDFLPTTQFSMTK